MTELIVKEEKSSFEGHLREAIAINSERREIYSAMTAGRSRKLSNRLIWGERMTLVVALYFDNQARPFQREGIGVVGEDFVPMDEIRAPESPPDYRGLASDQVFDGLHHRVASLAKRVRKRSPDKGFEEIYQDLLAAIHDIEEREAKVGAHFTMVKHVLESAGLAALNAEKWSEMSGGRTVRLSKRLVDVQLRWVKLYLSYDRLAQELHQEGCGILLNDVPAIPLLKSEV